MTKVRLIFEVMLDDVDDEVTRDRVIAGLARSNCWAFPDREGDSVFVDLESATLVEFEKS